MFYLIAIKAIILDKLIDSPPENSYSIQRQKIDELDSLKKEITGVIDKMRRELVSNTKIYDMIHEFKYLHRNNTDLESSIFENIKLFTVILNANAGISRESFFEILRIMKKNSESFDLCLKNFFETFKRHLRFEYNISLKEYALSKRYENSYLHAEFYNLYCIHHFIYIMDLSMHGNDDEEFFTAFLSCIHHFINFRRIVKATNKK